MNNGGDFDLIGMLVSFAKKHALTIMTSCMGAIAPILAIIAVVAAVLLPVIAIVNIVNPDDNHYDITNPDDRDKLCLEEFGIVDKNTSEGKTTLEYCRTLYDVVDDYKEVLGVNIDPIMITATLFYGRTYDNYTNDSVCVSDDEESCEKAEAPANASEFATWFSDPEYNKKAKKHIKVLASYMLLKTTTRSSCGAKSSFTTTPETIEDVANSTWDLLDDLSKVFALKNGASKRTAVRVSTYEGDPTEPQSCPYENDEPKYINKYINSNEYKTINVAYNNFEKACSNVKTQTDKCEAAELNYRKLVSIYSGKFSDWYQNGLINSPTGSNDVTFKCQYTKSESYKSNRYFYKGCALSPYQVDQYSVDYKYKGLYYYKLMAPMDKFLSIWTSEKESFISKYYDYIVNASNETKKQENVEKVVEEIYTLYETVMEGESANNQGGTPGVTGPFETWSQKDPTWGSVVLGPGSCNNSTGKGCPTSIYEIGCAATSIAIQLARSGAQVNVNGELNPGTFVEAWSAVGGFSGGGYILDWSSVNKVASNFYLTTISFSPSVAEIENYANGGYYVILKVIKNEHWVAVSRVENGEVYIYDPFNSKGEEALSSAGWGTKYGMYKMVVYEIR